MFSLIIPAASQATFGDSKKPAWMMTHPNGTMMITECIRGLNLDVFDKIFIAFLEQHIRQYQCLDEIKQELETLVPADRLEFVLLESPTSSQAETIAQILELKNLSGSFFVKDADNYFAVEVSLGNYIATFSLDYMPYVNPHNKSYLLINENDNIVNIVEKKIVSSFFNVGGYGFESVEQYQNYYQRLKYEEGLYLSHIIFQMLLDECHFKPLYVNSYHDWGTFEDWHRFYHEYKVFLVEIDGIICIDESETGPGRRNLSVPIHENIEKINEWVVSATRQVILLTSRPEEQRNTIIKQLQEMGVKYHGLLCGLNLGNKILIDKVSLHSCHFGGNHVNVPINTKDLAKLFP